MKMRLLTVTHKSPVWIKQGYEEYAKRLPPAYALELIEIPAEKRSANLQLERLKEREGEKILSIIKPDHHVIALDVQGKMWTTAELARQLADWQQAGQTVDLLIGGPDGLSPQCLQRSNARGSLSSLTFPLFLVKILIAEQLYRAYTILQQHPYHRG